MHIGASDKFASKAMDLWWIKVLNCSFQTVSNLCQAAVGIFKFRGSVLILNLYRLQTFKIVWTKTWASTLTILSRQMNSLVFFSCVKKWNICTVCVEKTVPLLELEMRYKCQTAEHELMAERLKSLLDQANVLAAHFKEARSPNGGHLQLPPSTVLHIAAMERWFFVVFHSKC